MKYFSLYLTPRFFGLLFSLVFLFVLSFWWQWVYILSELLYWTLFILTLVDIVILYSRKKGLQAERHCKEKLSNGDENPILLKVENRYPFALHLRIIDEAPIEFQLRDLEFTIKLEAQEKQNIRYTLRPVKRGEQLFGAINIFAITVLGLAKRRYRLAARQIVAVYPSYLQMRKYELLASSDRLSEAGIKKIRRLGHNMEFEQIKEYVRGDDVRTINWKATARRNQLMVNQYQDERSQQIYNLIDKGRLMEFPFKGMTLLDYAINASLVLSSIAIMKQDKAGLLTFSKEVEQVLPAGKTSGQMAKIVEILYKQRSNFDDSNFEQLSVAIKQKIRHRSLLILYTNFASPASLERQLPYLKRLAFYHLLVVVFFENTEMQQLSQEEANNTEGIYLQTIAADFIFQQRQIVKELRRNGIYAVLTSPEHLIADTVNEYLALKARGLI